MPNAIQSMCEPMLNAIQEILLVLNAIQEISRRLNAIQKILRMPNVIQEFIACDAVGRVCISFRKPLCRCAFLSTIVQNCTIYSCNVACLFFV